MKITEEWLSAFPQLTAFTLNKLYKIVGCTIIGIELIRLPHSEAYRPHFVIYPLWEKDLKNSLKSPLVLSQIYDKKGLQFSIPYIDHSKFFNEGIKCLKAQVHISMNDDIALQSFFNMIDSYFDDILVKSNSGEQAKLFELKFFLALYVGSEDQMWNILNQIKKESKNWNMQMFEKWYGKFDTWLQDLENKIAKRSEFLQLILVNKQDKKLIKLKYSELIQ